MKEIVYCELSHNGMDASLNHIDVSHIYSMDGLFFRKHDFCGDVSLWDVSSGDSFKAMFMNCRNLTADLSQWNIRMDFDVNLWFMLKNCPAKKPQCVVEYEKRESEAIEKFYGKKTQSIYSDDVLMLRFERMLCELYK